MDTALSIFAKAISPFFYPVMEDQRIFWLYLLSAGFIAAGAYLYGRAVNGRIGAAATDWRGFKEFLLPRDVFLHRSAIVDYKYFVINAFGMALIVSPILLGAPAVADLTKSALAPLAGAEGARLIPGAGDHLGYTLVMIIAMDGAIFLAHFLQHKVPALWEFHKVHHSAEVLTPITVYRMHPVDDILTGVLSALILGVVDGIFRTIYAASPTTMVLFNLNIFLFLFYLAGYNLRHSHVWVSYPQAVSHFLVSPAQHQIHHSSAEKHFDKNLGFIFAFWDAFAGTLYVPKGRENLKFGLDGDEHQAFDSVWQLYARPFRVVFAKYLSPKRSQT